MCPAKGPLGTPFRRGERMSDAAWRTRMKNAWISLAVCSLVGCGGWAPGKQAYWDAQLKEMCQRDGGLTVYQRVPVSKDQISRRVLPMTRDGRLGFALRDLAHPDAPVYSVEKITTLRDSDPIVRRTESAIVRRSDQVVVGRWIRYARVGGDLPTGLSEGTSFVCPDMQQLTSDVHNRLFLIEGTPEAKGRERKM